MPRVPTEPLRREKSLPQDPAAPSIPPAQACLHLLLVSAPRACRRSEVTSVPGTGEFPEQLRVSVYLGDFPLCPPMTRSRSAQKPARQLLCLSDSGGTEPRLAGLCVCTKELYS